jgi:hypothetical protein
MEKIKKWWSSLSKLAKSVIVVFALIIVLPIIVPAGQDSSGDSDSPENPQVSTEVRDVSTIEGLTYALSDELGQETNTGVPRGLDVSIVDGDLYVLFALNENLSRNLTIGSAWQDVSEVVKLVQLSGLSNNLTVNGTLELIDTNGNSLGQRIVLTANFLDDKVPLLNTENIVGRERWEAATTSFIYHPAIRD